MFNSVVNLLVHHFLVDRCIRMVTLRTTAHHGQSHHTVTQQRHLVTRVVIHTHRHLILWRFLLVGRCLLGVTLAGREQCGSTGHTDRSTTEYLEEIPSIYLLCHISL